MNIFLAILLVTFAGVTLSQRGPGCNSPKIVGWLPTTGAQLPLQKINGTDLYTGIYYKISLKKFPTGYFTWTQSKLPEGGGNYAQIDVNPANLPHYAKGGKWFNDVQWVLEPAAEKKGSYRMRNKARPSAGLSNKKDVIDGSNYQVLSLKDDVTGAETTNTHLKVVMTDEKGPYKYQLKLDKFPEGTVTWTDKKYGEHSHYIQVSEVADHKKKYQKGSEWWDDTLFSFTPELDGLVLKGFLSQLEFGDALLKKYASSATTLIQESTKAFTSSQNHTISTEDVDAIKDKSWGKLVLNEPTLSGLPNMGFGAVFTLPNLRTSESIYAPSWRLVSEPGKWSTAQAHHVPEQISKWIEVPTGVAKIGVSYVSQVLKNVELPFKGMMVIQGQADRMKGDYSAGAGTEWKDKGEIPAELVLEALVAAGVPRDGLVIVGDKVVKWVEGELHGNFVIGFDIVGAPLK